MYREFIMYKNLGRRKKTCSSLKGQSSFLYYDKSHPFNDEYLKNILKVSLKLDTILESSQIMEEIFCL